MMKNEQRHGEVEAKKEAAFRISGLAVKWRMQ